VQTGAIGDGATKKIPIHDLERVEDFIKEKEAPQFPYVDQNYLLTVVKSSPVLPAMHLVENEPVQ